MDLFDTVICDYELPLPEFTEDELKDITSGIKEWTDWSGVEWQTKDMGGVLDIYSIEDDGQIYLRPTNWLEDGEGVSPGEGELEKFEKTAEINFYQMFLGKEYDYWIEFKATTWKGELRELELAEYKKEDNADRLEMQGKMKEQIGLKGAKGKTYGVYRYIVTLPLHIARLILGFFIGVTLKIQRWLP